MLCPPLLPVSVLNPTAMSPSIQGSRQQASGPQSAGRPHSEPNSPSNRRSMLSSICFAVSRAGDSTLLLAAGRPPRSPLLALPAPPPPPPPPSGCKGSIRTLPAARRPATTRARLWGSPNSHSWTGILKTRLLWGTVPSTTTSPWSIRGASCRGDGGGGGGGGGGARQVDGRQAGSEAGQWLIPGELRTIWGHADHAGQQRDLQQQDLQQQQRQWRMLTWQTSTLGRCPTLTCSTLSTRTAHPS